MGLHTLSPLKHQQLHPYHALSLVVFPTVQSSGSPSYSSSTLLSSLTKASSADHHLYSDDTQLLIFFSSSSFSESIHHILSVVTEIPSWMTSNLLCLNP